MRKLAVVVFAFSAGVGVASAQGLNPSVLQKDPSPVQSFGAQPSVQLGQGGTASSFAAAPAATDRVPGGTFAVAGPMTAPTAPGSGMSVAFGGSEMGQGMSAGSFSKDVPEQGGFSTASATPNEVGPSGVPSLLGLDLTTGATTSFGASGMTGPGIKLGQ